MKDNTDQVFAPVLIATLNRYTHFRRCLESLEKCTDAQYTDVHVALDYPPSEKYVEGWKKIDEYLKEKEEHNSFKNLIVYRRDHNYGVCREGGNYEVLIDDICKDYDRYILTEDDNEFSPCFLQYMNKSFEKFYDDERVFLICGYNYKMEFPEMYRNNFYLSKWGCPWGTGEWVHKRKELKAFCSESKLKECLLNDDTYHLLKERNPRVLLSAIKMIKNHELLADSIKGVYSTLFDRYCLMPRESMVRNWGNDGTGDHSKRMNKSQNDYFVSQNITKNEYFEFTNDIFTYEPVFLKRQHFEKKKSLKNWYKTTVLRIDLFLFRHFKFMPKTKYL